MKTEGEDQRVLVYSAALDCTRAVAVLLVMAFHFLTPHRVLLSAGLALSVLYRVANLGWLGVDLFFVLSGYLITSILIETRGCSKYFRTFWLRRVWRIFPIYYLALLVVFVVAPTADHLGQYGLLSGDDYGTLQRSQGWFWAYLSNVPAAFWARGSQEGGLFSLVHFWSLAIEEQFYLVWPFVVRWCDQRKLVRVCVAAAVCAFLLRFGFRIADLDYNAAYCFTLCRVDCLCLGALLAATPTWPTWLRRGLLAQAVICLGYLMLDATWHKTSALVQTVGYTSLALGAAALISWMESRPRAKRRVGIGSLAHLGRYSYGIYVWHLLWYPAARDGFFSVRAFQARGLGASGAALLQAFSMTVMGVLAGATSYWLVERPFLKLKPKYQHNEDG